MKQLDHLLSAAGLVAAHDEHHFRKDARNQAIRWSCRLGSSKCLNETNHALEGFLTSNSQIHQDHRAEILCAGIRTASAVQLTQMLNRLANENDPENRLRFVGAMGCTSNLQWAERLLQMTIDEQSRHFRTAEERYLVFTAIAGTNHNGTKLAFEFLNSNLDAFNSFYEGETVNNAIKLLATLVASDELTEKVNNYQHYL